MAFRFEQIVKPQLGVFGVASGTEGFVVLRARAPNIELMMAGGIKRQCFAGGITVRRRHASRRHCEAYGESAEQPPFRHCLPRTPARLKTLSPIYPTPWEPFYRSHIGSDVIPDRSYFHVKRNRMLSNISASLPVTHGSGGAVASVLLCLPGRRRLVCRKNDHAIVLGLNWTLEKLQNAA